MSQRGKYSTNDYILNVAEVYKNCKQPEIKKPIYVSNCEPNLNYYCPLPGKKCWKDLTKNHITECNDIKETNDIVYQNIKRGGVLCDFKPRSNINTMLNERHLTEYHTNHCNYSNNVDTEFYLRHGESTFCSKEWINRHYKKNQ
jgi:hypothetical protein